MLATSCAIGGETNAGSSFAVVSGTGKVFLAAGGVNVPDEFRHLLVIQSKEPKLKASEHRAVADSLWSRMAEILCTEIVPSGEFIAQNILLYPADEQNPADLAALRYQKGSNEYMVVVSGRDVYRLYLFVRGKDVSLPESAYGETNAILKIASTVLRLTSAESSFPPDIIVEKRGTIGVMRVKLRGDGKRNILNGLKGVCMGDEVALSVTTNYRCLMANRPPPGAWFEEEDRALKTYIEGKKKLEEVMSPENVERERHRLAIELGDIPPDKDDAINKK